MLNSNLKAHLALLTANIIYSASFIIAKDAMQINIAPSGLVFIRVVSACIMFWLLSAIFVKEKIERKHIIKTAILGIFGVATNQLFFLNGLHMTTPINAAILMVTTPILVLIISAIVVKEKINFTNIGGVIIGFIGAALLVLMKKDSSEGTASLKGDLFIFINALSWGIYLVLAKPLMKQYNTFTILKWAFLFGSIYVLPFGLTDVIAIRWTAFTPYIWFCLVFIVLFVTVIAYLLNTYALKALSSSVVSAYIYLQPLLAAVIALAAQKDKLSWIKIVAALLIFVGVYMASKKAAPPDPSALGGEK
jgi:drug/metabolite transporter (DMT)-like permease